MLLDGGAGDGWEYGKKEELVQYEPEGRHRDLDSHGSAFASAG